SAVCRRRPTSSSAGRSTDRSTRSLGHAKEPWARPMRPSNPLGDYGQRAITLPLIFEPVLANEDGVGVSAPLSHPGRAGFQHETWGEGPATSAEHVCGGLQGAPQRPANAAIALLLQLIGEGSDQEITTEPVRRTGAMQFPPGKPQFGRRLIHQYGNLAVHLGDIRIAGRGAASTGNGRKIVNCRLHALGGSAMR